MDKLVDNFSKQLEENIKSINKLKQEGSSIDTLNKRLDLLSFCMGIIERAYNDLLSFKDSHNSYDLITTVDYDYRLSCYADRFYNQSKTVVALLASNQDHPVIRLIPQKKKNTCLQLSNLMLHIAARWNIERIINVYEYDTNPENKAFPKRKPLLDECIFFANRMNATRMGIKFNDGIMPKKIIFSVQPSGGKSFIANVYSLMSLCLHHIYYHTSGILRMSNNSSNACGFADQIKAMLEDVKITTIYPEFKQYFIDGKPKILEKSASDEWRMVGLDPRIRASHFARGRDSAINSIRVFVAIIIDDLSDGFDQMNNDEAHQQMTTKYYVDMESRSEDENIPIFLIGTMFNEFDVPNDMINKLEMAGQLITDTRYKNVRRTLDWSTVVITVDCFDKKGESVAPRLISTNKLRERQNALKPYEFDLVYRQIRSSREPRIFDYGNLKVYDKLPETLSTSRIAVLDPTRKNGSDYFSLPVFAFNEADDDRDAYFIDCIYEQKSLGKQSDPSNKFFAKVIKFLIDNNVRQFYIENNTSNTLGTLFEEKFKENNYYCQIYEFYTSREKGSKNKLERIVNEEPTITGNIRFPRPLMFPPLHRISQFMNDFTRFDSKNENGSNRKQHDDAPDSVAIFSKRCLFNRGNRFSEVKGLSKSLLWKKF